MIFEATDNNTQVLLERYLYLKGSKTSYFIMKSYKSLMTEGFKTFYFQPFTLWRLLDFMILRADILTSTTKTKGLDF